jgi:hypothetical protein
MTELPVPWADYPRFGPMTADHPGVGMKCPACFVPIEAGDFVTLIPLGPGDDPKQQEKAREGRAYNAVTALVHWTCATGQPSPQ